MTDLAPDTVARLLEDRASATPRGLSTRKLPEQLEYVEVLPRNAMGKVVKRELTVQFARKETV
jgi:non-ribosomal peptide synthetase component E (peptide arylation enzyme)